MKMLLKKCVAVVILTYSVIVLCNYYVDTANIFHTDILVDIAEKLHGGKIVENPGNIDEGLFQKTMIQSMTHTPETVVVGSSHIMYEPWEFDDYYVAGLSGAYLGDYYATIGLLEEANHMPQHIVIGVDPWAFMSAANAGRHVSINDFARREIERVSGSEASKYTGIYNDGKSTLKKVKELLSISYFQASVSAIKSNGIKYYLHRQVVCVDNSELGKKSKIMPTGRRIFAQGDIHTVQENDNDVAAALRKGSIYQLGKGFSELQMSNLEEFESLICYLQAKGVKVEFYLHPWYPDVYDYFKNNVQFSGVLKTENYLREMANRHGIIVHGSYDPELTHSNKEDFADWFHLKANKMLDSYNIIL